MEIVKKLTNKSVKPTVVALGNFDGLHVGHQTLIKRTVDIAQKENLVSTVFTFDNHTTSKIKGKNTPKILISKNRKIALFKELGVKLLYIVQFTETLMHFTPLEFIEKILVDILNVRKVVVGFNFKFGYLAKGDVKYLKEMGEKYNFDVIVVPPITKDNILVSSTQIRELIREGEISLANKLLGRQYLIEGKVIRGRGIGRKLGFPTANISFDSDIVIPKAGVYKTNTIVDGSRFPSITNIGFNPTFNGGKLSIETHILDYSENIYDKTILIEFIDFIRKERKFDDVNKLIEQVKLDIKTLKNIN
ncbi:bifunctional riboflavin kinase/FAD synthetase [Caloranaerobacter azorensis]|uniref:Riboflavin biosynthesis protein n=1 Tax=Caloranaerobacter azorensis TaxID=116090 RepID=A0A6P1YD85_9FIRM|nr:bifunctional riboflavin kinase/FAD synthetase [Caloranaerobacter azorensis]QIB26145.1 bifunctional riboflavin kinase/FAD synthetase [Caloranaerobacter azorensis]